MLASSVAPAQAQVDVEPFRERLNTLGRTLRVRQSVTVRTGNTEGAQYSSGTLLGLQRARSLAYLTASGDYSKQNGETLVQKSFGHLRYNYLLWDRLAGEAFAQVETDRFRLLRHRELLGLGPRVTLLQYDIVRLHWGTSAMMEWTERNQQVEALGRNQQNLRWSNYLACVLELHERIRASETLYYQPKFSDFSNFWLLSVASAVFEVTDVLASRIDVTVRREATVPTGVKQTDTEVASSLQVSF